MMRTLSERLSEFERITLSDHAVLSKDGFRRRSEQAAADFFRSPPSSGILSGHPLSRLNDYRQAFTLDADRILHSLAYTRYIDKTQVFSLIHHDHITHRVLHVQLVSKIARTIGRYLGLNQDLIEAVALGHDIGHPPFGHDGETILSRLCEEHGIGGFRHNVQSVRFLDEIERKGRGWNLCLQTLDGILCHDGEVHDQSLRPDPEKNFDRLAREMEEKTRNARFRLTPMTSEGCVVRFADTVGYIGRDMEDAIRLGLITRDDLPADIVAVLGNTNGKIVFRLVTDIIHASMDTGGVRFSAEVSEALKALKQFNYEQIYLNPRIKIHMDRITELYTLLFHRYLEDLQADRRDSVIFTGYLADMSSVYRKSRRPAEIVRDFIAGMTDRYFLQNCPESLRPEVAQGF